MAEKPILFSSEMVRAVSEGRKTQTRRVMKPQPVFSSGYWWYDEKSFCGEDDLQDYLFHNVYGFKGSPYGSAYDDGTFDTIWVRETWQAQNHNGQWWHEVPKNERSLHNWALVDKATPDPDLPTPPKWIPSIFMPRWASRITLNVVDVRVERLQKISEDDAETEGVQQIKESAWVCYGDCLEHKNGHCYRSSATASFMSLWDSINLKRGFGWDTNPWVWVVEFEVVTK